LKQAAPAMSPALAAIIAAAEASISTFCWIAEHPTSAAKIMMKLISFEIT
jgi:hypothetical protein